MLLQPTSALCVLDGRYVELFSFLFWKKVGHWNTVLGLAHKLNPFFSEKNLLVLQPIAHSNQLVISGTQLYLLAGTLDTLFLISFAVSFWARVDALVRLCALSHLLLPANEVWCKDIFSEACVKLSVHRGRGGLPQYMLGYHTPAPGTRNPPPRTRHHPPHPRAEHAGRYGQRAGGMHPTRMQSCYYFVGCGQVKILSHLFLFCLTFLGVD